MANQNRALHPELSSGELIQQRSIRLTPSPSPALGRGEPMLATCQLYQTRSQTFHHDLKSSAGVCQSPENSMEKTFNVINFGCRATQADGAAIEQALQQFHLRKSEAWQRSDVVVINTCTVTNTADVEARQMIRRVHRENPTAKNRRDRLLCAART